MTVVPNSRGAFFVDGIFDDSNTRNLKGTNVFFENDESGEVEEMDSITLQVVDSAGTEQYTLTTVSSPAITMESPANVYVVTTIDVTGFADGDISLTWTGTLDGYEHTHVQTVSHNTTPDMVFIEGLTDTMEDFKVILDTDKTFTIRVRDTLNNPVDGYDARLAIQDRNTSAITRYDGALQALGTGLWKTTPRLSSSSYSADLDRYEAFWEVQITEGGTWREILNSRVPLKFYNQTTDVQAGPITYSSNDDLRRTFPGIDKFLEDVVANQGEREIWLNRKRYEASHIIYSQVKNSRIRANRELLGLWESYEVYRLILINAHSFAKFSVQDGQLELLEKQIRRIRNSLFGPIQTIRIGGRVNT